MKIAMVGDESGTDKMKPPSTAWEGVLTKVKK